MENVSFLATENFSVSWVRANSQDVFRSRQSEHEKGKSVKANTEKWKKISVYRFSDLFYVKK